VESLPRRKLSVNLLVLDSSVTLAWIYGDETPETVRQIFHTIAENGAVGRPSGGLRSPIV
jgi:hypothetical protein